MSDKKAKRQSATMSTASEAVTKMIDRKASFLKRGISKGTRADIDPTAIGVFGKRIADVIQQQGHIGGIGSAHMKAGIPIIVQECLEHIVNFGLEEEGLFRIPGDTAQVEKLKQTYDVDCRLAHRHELSNYHMNSVAGCIKLYFRELPEPILTHRLYSTFITVGKNTSEMARKTNLRLMIRKLPEDNRKILIYLMHHLHKISLHCEKNKMTSNNLATCWAPNLLRPEKETTEQMMNDVETVNTIITILIEEIEFMSETKAEDSSDTLRDLRTSPSFNMAFLPPALAVTPVENAVAHKPEAEVKQPHPFFHWITSQPEPTATNPEKKGSLSFRSPGKKWGTAFFRLQGCILRYYRDESFSELYGLIHMSQYNVVPRTKGSGTYFALVNPLTPHEITWKFQASAQADRDKWIEHIQKSKEAFFFNLKELEYELPQELALKQSARTPNVIIEREKRNVLEEIRTSVPKIES